ncbi:hypothetical protein [Paroceanicella profunda]|uniref:hypothetical protein n=1 Tax=Paroceanicella profunda TaxID=2579971 RepID=UPI00147922B9|nr:hypothetical protein [Paroceanicella profunda]
MLDMDLKPGQFCRMKQKYFGNGRSILQCIIAPSARRIPGPAESLRRQCGDSAC